MKALGGSALGVVDPKDGWAKEGRAGFGVVIGARGAADCFGVEAGEENAGAGDGVFAGVEGWPKPKPPVD